MVETETLILFIIIGIISTIFGKGRKGNGQSNLPKSIEEMRKRIIDQHETIPTLRKFSVAPAEIKESTEEKPREFKHSSVKPITATIPVVPTVNNTESPIYSQQIEIEPELTATNEVDATHVINGIIWSEILGEPRARKPYFSRKN